MTDASNVLRIDDKWSVKFDPNCNDHPKAWLRHGEHQGPFIEHNGVVAMFYALRERADLTPSPEVVKELVEALGTVRDYVADTASGHLQYRNRAPLQAMAQEDLARIDAVLAKLEGGE